MLKSCVKKSRAQRLQEWFYPESKVSGMTIHDGTVAFYSQIRTLIRPSDTLLDIGCGRGQFENDNIPYRRNLRVFKGEVARVIGIDVGSAGKDNTYLDEFRMIDGTTWPLDDKSVDIAICDYVLEHVEEPDLFFAEVQRVLKPGGYFLARTANLWGYVAIVSRLIPNRMHASVVAAAQENRKEEDVFPTFYRCNSRSAIYRQLDKHGLNGVVTTNSSEPSYLGFSSLAYFLGVLHQKFSPSFLDVGLMVLARRQCNQ